MSPIGGESEASKDEDGYPCPLIGGGRRRSPRTFSRKRMRKTLIRGADKEAEMRQQSHVTRPPRLEGKSKNAMMNPVRKPKAKDNQPSERSDRPGSQD